MSAEDAFLDLLVDTLDGLDRSARGQFLQRFFRAIAQVDLTEEASLEYWEQVLERRRELSETQGQPVPLKTALVSVLASVESLRFPILMEYADLKKLQINAATDPLTGLYNRRLFEEYFIKELNRAQRYGHQLAMVILDLHQFKEVNDRYGHPQGDRVLQSVARTLWKTLRVSDYAFRIGGDEFAVLLPQTDPEQAGTLARRLRANYESAIAAMNLEPLPTVDFGVAVYPDDGEQKDELIRVADERLYQMKTSDRPRRPRTTRPEPPPERPERLERAERGERKEPAAPARPTAPKPPATPEAPPPSQPQRRWERVSLAGTRAYAVIGEDGGRTARILDLSYGGVALQIDGAEDLPAVFPAVLHVPILPPVKVSLRKAYVKRADGQGARVGCAFVS